MRFFVLLMLIESSLFAQQNADSLNIRKIYSYHLTESETYANLRSLCKGVGCRLSGSNEAAKAVYWAKQAMLKAGADSVYLVPCIVPHWVRDKKEKCEVYIKNKAESLSICALG